MKDTLQLNEIAGYLPYGLPIQILNHQCDYVGIEFSKANGYYFIGELLHVTYDGGSSGKDVSIFKPILRPMSELTRPMLEEAGFECHIDYLTYEFNHWVELHGIDHVINMLPYGHAQWLYRNHYDLHDLIGRGLAVDINTLKD